MKKIIFTAVMFIAVLLIAVPFRASASELSDEEAEISGQIDEIMSDYDIGLSYGEISGLSFGELIGRAWEVVSSQLAAPMKVLGTLLIVSVFTAVMKSFGEGVFPVGTTSNLYDMICVMTAVAVITPQLLDVYGGALTSIERSGGFLLVFVPVFAGITIAMGGITSGGIYNIMTLAASEVFVGLSRSYLMPILSVTAVLAVSGSVFPNTSVESFVTLMKKIVTWGMTVAMTLFTGFVTLKCTLAGKTDGVATKTAKFIMSGFVPIVGGAVSDAYSTVRGGFDVIRGTVGTVGVLAVVLIMLPPILKILVFRVVMWIGTAVSEMLSAAPLVKLMKGLDSGLAIAQSVLICYSLMFVLCTAILMQAVG